jgi:hypothetical protein
MGEEVSSTETSKAVIRNLGDLNHADVTDQKNAKKTTKMNTPCKGEGNKIQNSCKKAKCILSHI